MVTITLLLMYTHSPNNDCPSIFEDIQNTISNESYCNIILGGDFNLVLNLDIYKKVACIELILKQGKNFSIQCMTLI